MATIRPAAVAGRFYPGRQNELQQAVAGYIAEARPWSGPMPAAIIGPHAGYVYSGPIAGSAYAPVVGHSWKRVILIGPSHFVPVAGMAVPTVDTFATPMGDIALDRKALDALVAEFDTVVADDEPHRREHGLEVHLPFLIETLGSDFLLVPIVTGDCTGEQVAAVLEAADGPETLFVISTDLSHFYNATTARQLDEATCRAIENRDPDAIAPRDACGRLAVQGMLHLARARNLDVATLDLRNSADTAGDPSRVVGYGAWVLT